jgi:uncharacterized membrane protein YidH (DUF202 family)
MTTAILVLIGAILILTGTALALPGILRQGRQNPNAPTSAPRPAWILIGVGALITIVGLILQVVQA